jgi:hypothetical protein
LVSPQLRCSRCRCVYYCSKTCQIKHWSKHKSECRDVNILKAQLLGSDDSNIAPVDMTQRVNAAVEMSCGICLEDTIEKPHTLSNCQHVFCYPCLQAYQSTCKRVHQPLRCPLCRADTEDVQRKHCEAAFFYLCRAGRKPKSSLERKELLQIALSELEHLSKDDVKLYLQGMVTKMSILDMLKDHESVLTAIEEILLIDTTGRNNYDKFMKMLKEGPDETQEEVGEGITQLSDINPNSMVRMTPEQRIDIMIQKASTYENMEDWKQTMKAYKDVVYELERHLQGTTQKSTPQQYSVLMGLSRCCYHIEEFDLAITLGEVGIPMNRHFPRAHKYVALSYKAKGDLESAIKVMSQAVLYETPWDEENMYQAKVLLDELIKCADKSLVA